MQSSAALPSPQATRNHQEAQSSGKPASSLLWRPFSGQVLVEAPKKLLLNLFKVCSAFKALFSSSSHFAEPTGVPLKATSANPWEKILGAHVQMVPSNASFYGGSYGCLERDAVLFLAHILWRLVLESRESRRQQSVQRSKMGESKITVLTVARNILLGKSGLSSKCHTTKRQF